jgi:Icc protein
MTRPFLVAQLTDTHIGADWGGPPDPTAALLAAVDALGALPDRPDAVLVTGDLANDGTAAQYAPLREQLQRLRMPFVVLPGNHDDRGAMRTAFGLPGDRDDPIHAAVDLGPLRLLALDTTIPGEDGGALPEAELQWLARSLRETPERPAIIAMHHPPVLTGVAPWDATAIGAGQQAALERLLMEHPQVRRPSARRRAEHLPPVGPGLVLRRLRARARAARVRAARAVRGPARLAPAADRLTAGSSDGGAGRARCVSRRPRRPPRAAWRRRRRADPLPRPGPRRRASPCRTDTPPPASRRRWQPPP